MKQFGTIFQFELVSYFKNKVFVGVTIFLVVVIAGIMFFPNVKNLIEGRDANAAGESETAPEGTGADEAEAGEITGALLLFVPEEYRQDAKGIQDAFQSSFPEYEVLLTEDETEQIKEKVMEGDAECAFVLEGMDAYTYYVNNLPMYDANTEIVDEVLQNMYRVNAMVNGGMTAEEAQEALSVEIRHETESLGKDQMKNFLYTYIMIFAHTKGLPYTVQKS